MFTRIRDYCLRQLRCRQFSEVSQIQFTYTYERHCRYSDTVFYTGEAKCQCGSMKNLLRETINFSRQLGCNRLVFSILDGDGEQGPAVARDRLCCEKISDSSTEIVFDRPGRRRVETPAGRSPALLLLFPVLVMTVYFLCKETSLVLDSMVASTGIYKNWLLMAVPMLLLLSVLLLYILFGYGKYLYGISREQENFAVSQLTAGDYPVIKIVAAGIVYERYGRSSLLLWRNIAALSDGWGNTFFLDDMGERYPIPTYGLISCFDNDILLECIIVNAGMIRDGQRDIWANLSN